MAERSEENTERFLSATGDIATDAANAISATVAILIVTPVIHERTQCTRWC